MTLPWWVEQDAAEHSKGRSIEYIKANVSIRTLLEHYGATVPTGFSGEWRSMLCPFHADTHASASINDKLARFSCLTCGISGDVVDLVREEEGLSISEAIQWISMTLL